MNDSMKLSPRFSHTSAISATLVAILAIYRLITINNIIPLPSILHQGHIPCLNSSSSVQLRDVPSDMPSTLSKYIYWHREMRECLSSSNCQSTPQLLVWRCRSDTTKDCAGIGDRFRGIQFALLLAIVSNRVLFVNWPQDHFALDVALTPALIDWRPPLSVDLSQNWTTLDWFRCTKLETCPMDTNLPNDTMLVSPNIDHPYIDISRDSISKLHAAFNNLSITSRQPSVSIEKVLRNPHVSAIFKDIHPEFIPLREIIRLLSRTLFQPSNDVLSMMRASMPRYAKQPYIGIHMRTGDDLNESTMGRFVQLSQYRDEGIHGILNCARLLMPRENLKIFLAADSASLKEKFKDVARSKNMLVTTLSESPIHIDKQRELFTGPYKLKVCRSYLAIFADLLLLAGGERIITTGSGFANASFFLGDASTLHVMKAIGNNVICRIVMG